MNTFKARLLSILILASLLAVLPGSHVHARGSVLYVNRNATGANTGTSWANAYTDLQSALNRASAGTDIWVASARYKPTKGPNRNATFQLKAGVRVFGGFVGNETALNQRDPVRNVTILSGDIGLSNVGADNSYHVVTYSGDGYSKLDGFTISGGNADESSSHPCGGGLDVYFALPGTNLSLGNIIFSKNSAAVLGGALYANDGSISMEQVTFVENTATSQGGAMAIINGNYTLTKVIFEKNTAAAHAGAILNMGASLNISKSTFDQNSTTGIPSSVSVGGAIRNDPPATLNISNSTFYANSSDFGGAIRNSGTATISYSTFSHNTAHHQGDGVYNGYDASLVLNNSILANSTNGEDCYTPGAFSGNHNLIEVTGYGFTACGSPLSTADPNLGPLQHNGGYTDTMALLWDSPAIDAGEDADANCPESDQRGISRPKGSHCDLGAYETLPPGVGEGLYDDTDPAWSYAGNWLPYSGNGPYNNTTHYTGTIGDSADVVFNGTQFILTYTKASSYGLIEVYVDGTLVTTLNAYSTTTLWQRQYTSPVFASGSHTVRFVHAGGGTYVEVDAITILP